jgi:hypothetical protein
LKLSSPQLSRQHPSRICFITPGWHVTRNLNLLSLTMGANSKLSSNKCVYKTIMALKSNQLHSTIPKQMNSLSEYTKLSMKCLDHLIWKMKSNHKNLEKQEDNPFDYFLQSTAWDIRSTYHKTLQATLC